MIVSLQFALLVLVAVVAAASAQYVVGGYGYYPTTYAGYGYAYPSVGYTGYYPAYGYNSFYYKK